MARLTRTQKYADLRDQIAQDREESLETQDLNQFQNKLNSFESYTNSQNSSMLNNNYQQPRPFENAATNYQQAQRAYEEQQRLAREQAYQNEQAIKKAQEESMKSLDDILSSMMNAGAPKQEPTLVEQQVAQTKQDTVDLMSTMQIVTSEVNSLSDIIDNTENEYPQTELPKTNFEPTLLKEEVQPVEPQIQQPQQQAYVNNPDANNNYNAPVNNNFVNNTINEVNDFNRNAGRTTLEDLSSNLIDEIRHTDYRSQTGEDDEFSNTVSLEIDKVLSEIRNSNTQNIQPVNEPVIQQVQQPQVQPQIQPQRMEPKTLEETFNHPVLTKTQEAPVEIKNIDETLNNKFVNEANVLDDTIPFVVDKNEVDEEYYDDDEDEAPSKVLNVILGILIFVLIAVLGIIVYYILVAKGIIG